MNWMFLILLVAAIGFSALNGTLEQASEALMQTGEDTLGLVMAMGGGMMLWCGVLGVVEKSGLMHKVAGLLRPVLKRLFPGVKDDSEAMTHISANIAANLLGVGNAATPEGIRAMQALQQSNREGTKATDAMCMFLVINTSGLQLLPTGVMAVRSAAGSQNAGDIILPAFLATLVSTVSAVLLMQLILRLRRKDR